MYGNPNMNLLTKGFQVQFIITLSSKQILKKNASHVTH